MLSNLETLDWPKITRHLSSYATSGEGQDLLLRTSPLESEEKAVANFKIIKDAQNLLALGERPFMESLNLYHSWFQRLEKQSQLKPLELKDIRLFFMESMALKKIIKNSQSEWGEKIASEIMEIKGPLAAIEILITPQAEIRIDASETLYRLYNEKKNQVYKIQSALNNLVKAHENEAILQDKFVTNREGRWVIPVKSGMRHDISGIIHATSASKQTVFMEPQEVVPLNNQLKKIEAEIEEEIDKLLTQISQYLFTLLADIRSTRDLLLECDVRFAQAQFGITLNAKPIKFSTETVELFNVRHPLMLINGEKVIPNTVKLTPKDRILLLSGPNAGGKTVLLKCFGLAAQMARCGLPVCADENSSLPFFENMTVAVGDSQSVDSQLSTFVGHLKALNEACRMQGLHSLVLIDEICGSTDPEEGAALARGFINYYSARRIYGIITSHLGPLKTGWSADSGVVNGSMEYNRDTGTSTYNFIKGIPGHSLAFSTAKRIGVIPEVFDFAQKYLSPETRKRFETAEEIELVKDQINQLREELKIKIQETESEKLVFKKKILEFEVDRDKRLREEVGKIKERILEESKKANVQKLFDDHERRSNILLEFPEVIKAPNKEDDFTIDKFTKSFPPGSVAFSTSLQRDAIVQGAPNKQGEVPILAGSMRLMVFWEDLKPPKKASNPLSKRSFQTQVHVDLSDKGDTLDVRGKNVQLAIEELEKFLDKAITQRLDRVKIIHGHGSEALKKSIRSHLSRSVYVNRWSSSQESNGDDGATWIYIALD
jgi:DNA mismatch repair protein MutS2